MEQDQCNQTGESPDDEDISDECLVAKHDKALLEERKKFETYLKFPLTSRSRANRRIDSRGNESSGANTPTLDPTSPAPAMSTGDLEVRLNTNKHVAEVTHISSQSIPSPLDVHEIQETPSITGKLVLVFFK